MENTFYRPAVVDIKTYEKIVEKLRKDLKSLVSGQASEGEIIEYVKKAIKQGQPLQENNEMVFWGLGNPRNMPADGRVDFFYTPTYIMVSIMMKALLEIPEKVIRLDGFMDTLKRGMLACTGRRFMGSGYDAIAGLIDCLSIFETIDISLFLRAYPDICKEFTILYKSTVSRIRNALEKGAICNEWSESYTDRVRNFLEKLNSRENTIIFVYGTLMKGRCNHRFFLKGSRYMGKGILEGYSLYDLGSYPGIKKNEADKVKGELYIIDQSTLNRINQLEGEGTLYKLKKAPVLIGKKCVINAYVYEYLGEVNAQDYIPFYCQPWGKDKEQNKDDLVWYVAYGSNMLKERFMHYINGGQFRNNGRNHKPCKDLTSPRGKMNYKIPFNMYYANKSGSWDNKGVSFLDISKPGEAYGVAYLISKEQFLHIYKEENGGLIPRENSKWYNEIFLLGKYDGIDVLTFTNKETLAKNPPSQKYLNVLAEGLKENYPHLNDEEIWKYLMAKNT